MKLPRQVRHIFWDNVRMYFAPLVDAIKGICAECQRMKHVIERNRREVKACK